MMKQKAGNFKSVSFGNYIPRDLNFYTFYYIIDNFSCCPKFKCWQATISPPHFETQERYSNLLKFWDFWNEIKHIKRAQNGQKFSIFFGSKWPTVLWWQPSGINVPLPNFVFFFFSQVVDLNLILQICIASYILTRFFFKLSTSIAHNNNNKQHQSAIFFFPFQICKSFFADFDASLPPKTE